MILDTPEGDGVLMLKPNKIHPTSASPPRHAYHEKEGYFYSHRASGRRLTHQRRASPALILNTVPSAG